MTDRQVIPLALYIHVPWCIRKCPYCDFNSHQAPVDGLPEQDYIAALLKDLEQLLPGVWGRRISSIFLGGGTPSLLSASAVHDLLSGIRARIPCLPTAEISLEANPGSLETEKFQRFRDAGITRLSLGVQSFSDKNLLTLGRVHDAEQAHRAIVAVKACSFDSYNIDLMFGLPGQDIAAARQDLQTALDYRPPHLSLYQLTLEANTPFYRTPPAALPDDDLLADMQDVLSAQAGLAGLQRYEVSAYAMPAMQCRHNLNYWEFGDYLGIGAGAHSKITDQSGIRRFSRPRLPKEYMKSVGTQTAYIAERKLQQEDLVLEFMINALRLRQGFSIESFMRTTGLPATAIAEGISRAEEKGLLVQSGDNVRATERGFLFLSEIQLLFS